MMAEHRPQQEGEPPPDRDAQYVEEDEGAQGADDRAAPVGAVDRDVDPAAVPGGDQLVDGGVDRRVFTADAHARDEAGGVEEPDPADGVADRRGGQAAADEVDRQRQHEELAPAEPVGHVAEDERTDHLADEVDRRDQPGVGRGQVQGLGLGQDRGHGTGDGDFEAVEDPRDPQRDDHPGVER
jgi:hypothetical protein